jgi:hypothetical protein
MDRRQNPDSDAATQLVAPSEPTQDQIEEWQAIVDTGLPRALATLENGLKFANALEEKELGVQNAINAILAFILSIPRLSDSAEPLRKVLAAFQDADDGVLPSLFTPKRQAHRPLAPTDERIIRGSAAGAMDLLMTCLKYTKHDAARLVAETMYSVGIQVGDPRKERPPTKTIASWRDRAKSGDKRNHYDAMIYTEYISYMKPHVDAAIGQRDRDTIKRDILEGLGSSCRNIGARRRPTSNKNLSNPQC